MKRIVALAMFGLLGLGCGSSSSDLSPQDACNQIMSATCDYMNKCLGSAGLQLMGYTSVSACTTDMQKECTSTGSCGSGETYHGDKAQTCVDAYKSLTCTSTSDMPAACDQICQ